jgi:hypothetical protein
VGERHSDDQIERPGKQQRRQVAGNNRLVLADTENLTLGRQQSKEVDKTGVFHIADELIDKCRQYAPDPLRNDDEAHALPIAHAQGAACFHLPRSTL